MNANPASQEFLMTKPDFCQPGRSLKITPEKLRFHNPNRDCLNDLKSIGIWIIFGINCDGVVTVNLCPSFHARDDGRLSI